MYTKTQSGPETVHTESTYINYYYYLRTLLICVRVLRIFELLLFISCCLFVERCRPIPCWYFVFCFRETCRWERKVGRRWWCHSRHGRMQPGRVFRCCARTFLLPSDPPQHHRLQTHHHPCCGEKCSWWDGRSSWIHPRTPHDIRSDESGIPSRRAWHNVDHNHSVI